MSKNGEIYTTAKNFTLPPALTGWTNSTSACSLTMPKNCKVCDSDSLNMTYMALVKLNRFKT